MKHLLYSLLGIILLTGCKEDKYNLIIPMSEIYLNAPQDGTLMDLNDLSKDEYLFTWDKALEKGAKLIISTTRDFKVQARIDAGTTNTFALSVLAADQSLSKLGIKAGQESLIYWTVKETGNMAAGASDVRTMQVKRMSTKLISPEDMTTIALAEDKPETNVKFEWNTDGWAEGTTYSLCLSLDPAMEQGVVSMDLEESNGKASLTHEEIQLLLDKLAIKHYKSNSVYWNIKANNERMISRSSGALNLTEMMRFIDVRGDEKITYRVTRIFFSDKTSQVWLADNLRSTKYPDGTDMESSNYMDTPESFGNKMVKAYGVHYHYDIRDRIVPNGWRMPTIKEYETLFAEAGMVDGQWNVLKDTEFYEGAKGQPHLNAWKLNLCASGQWVGTAINNHTGSYCYLLALDEANHGCLLHDGGTTLWRPWTTGAPARFIYNEN